MFGVPSERAGDWNFRLLRFPVRVSAWFWIMALLLGPHQPRSAVIWVICVFVSILIHEMGHGLMARALGHRSQLILYEFGGLCVSDKQAQSGNERIAILAMGPGAQFLVLLALCAVGWAFLGITWQENIGLASLLLGIKPKALPSPSGSTTQIAWETYFYLFQINWLWPLLNLLPIWPLDGGQITGEVLHKVNQRDGRRWGHIIAMVTAGVLAVYTFVNSVDEGSLRLLRVMFFASFAFVNYQILQSYHRHHQIYGGDRDPDW
jgi:Zn-dependent protease